MINQVVWIDKDGTKRPNDQRAQILSECAEGHIMVKMLGDGMILAVDVGYVVGIEWNEETTTRFRLEGINSKGKK